jgi:hypothetical protein
MAMLMACGKKQQIAAPIIDASNPYLATVKIPLTTAQKAAGKKAGWETVSGLFIIQDSITATCAVNCEYTLADDTLYYTPRQPLGAGMQFAVKVFGNGDTITQKITTPNYLASAANPQVAAIYPLTNEIPVNILMFHVVFTEPMVESAQAYKQIKLLNEKGEEKQFVWRHKSNWTSDGKHLVMMLHPGRVKRDIRYFEEGDILFEPGKKYTLVVTATLLGRNNRMLEKEFTKQFTIVAPDRVMPVFDDKKLAAPKANTNQPVKLLFNEGMDYGTLLIGLDVKSKTGKNVEGEITANSDSSWSFIPVLPWEAGTYTVQLNDYTSDIAGNHLTRRFEETDAEEMKKREPVTAEFTVGK